MLCCVVSDYIYIYISIVLVVHCDNYCDYIYLCVSVVIYRLANIEESTQHVGSTRNSVDMKPNGASVHQEARCEMQHKHQHQQQQYCASQFNDGDLMKMSGTSMSRSWLQRRCQSFRSAKSISTMLHTFSRSAFYLFFTINTITIVAAATATATTAHNQALHSGNRIGVYAALSASDLNVPTTTEFSKYISDGAPTKSS